MSRRVSFDHFLENNWQRSDKWLAKESTFAPPQVGGDEGLSWAALCLQRIGDWPKRCLVVELSGE